MFRRALLVSALLLQPSVASAASGDALRESSAVETQSGSVGWPGDGETETIRAQRLERGGNLRQALLQDRKADLRFRERTAGAMRKRAERRRVCREDLRRSNRDTRLAVLLRCIRGELTLEREIFDKQRDRLEAIPGLDQHARALALSRLDLLADALDTVVFAIDNGVYRNSEDVSEARRSLLVRYRKPLWDALAAVRARRAAAMAGALILRMDAVYERELATGGSALDAWTEARRCLSAQGSALLALSSDAAVPDRPALVRAGTDEMLRCLSLLRILTAPESPLGSAASSSSASSLH